MDRAAGDFIKFEEISTTKKTVTKENDELSELSASLNIEEVRLVKLEEKRQQLEHVLTEVESKIQNERKLYREVIDAAIKYQSEECQCTQISEKAPVDIFSFDPKKIQNQINELQTKNNASDTDDETNESTIDLSQLKSNLNIYRSEISETKARESRQNQRKALLKMLREQLKEVEKKCDSEMLKIAEAKKEIKILDAEEEAEEGDAMELFSNKSNYETVESEENFIHF